MPADRQPGAMTRLDTAAVHAGREDLTALGVHVPPLDLSTTYPLPSVETGGAAYERLATGGRPGRRRTRWSTSGCGTPPSPASSARSPQLEGGAGAVAFGSGMAALSAILLGAGRRGPPARRRRPPAVRRHRPRAGLRAARHRGRPGPRRTGSPRRSAPTPGWSSWRRRPTPPSTWSTSRPSSPQAGDVPGAGRQHLRHPGAAAARHATVPPWSCTPPPSSSAATATPWAAWSPPTRTWLVRLRQVRAVTGGLLHPLAAYLLHRGLQTLPLRVRAQQETAAVLADRLAEHPGRRRGALPRAQGVRPARPGRHPDGRTRRLLAFELERRVRRRGRPSRGGCRLITHAVSLGGVDTLIQHPAGLTHRPVAADARPGRGPAADLGRAGGRRGPVGRPGARTVWLSPHILTHLCVPMAHVARPVADRRSVLPMPETPVTPPTRLRPSRRWSPEAPAASAPPSPPGSPSRRPRHRARPRRGGRGEGGRRIGGDHLAST